MPRSKWNNSYDRVNIRKTLEQIRSLIRYDRMNVTPAEENDEHSILADVVAYIENLRGLQTHDDYRTFGTPGLWRKLDRLIPETCFDGQYLKMRGGKKKSLSRIHGAGFYRGVVRHLNNLVRSHCDGLEPANKIRSTFNSMPKPARAVRNHKLRKLLIAKRKVTAAIPRRLRHR